MAVDLNSVATAAIRQRMREEAAEREREMRERMEHARMVELARGIHTEEALAAVLAHVEPGMRDAVEKILRPHVSIPIAEHE